MSGDSSRRHVLLLGAERGGLLAAMKPKSRFCVLTSVEVDACLRSGDFTALSAWLQGRVVDEIIFAPDAAERDLLPALLLFCGERGLPLSVSAGEAPPGQGGQRRRADGQKLALLNPVPLDRRAAALLKRLFDMLAGALLLVLFSPAMALCGLLLRLSGLRPALFRQRRVGRGGRTFELFKLRTMRRSPEENTAWTVANDPRRTRLGRFLRRYSIDELPQLIQVLRGDMSLVGPRPEIPYYVARFEKSVPHYAARHRVRPGITGLAQINGLRGDTDIRARVAQDLWYIENWSVGLDLKILLKTLLGGFVSHEM